MHHLFEINKFFGKAYQKVDIITHFMVRMRVDCQLLLNEVLELKPTNDFQLIHFFFYISKIFIALA